jgi:hypothetical protein
MEITMTITVSSLLKRHFFRQQPRLMVVAMVFLSGPFLLAQSSIAPSPDDVPPTPTHDVPAASDGYAITNAPPQAVSTDPVLLPDQVPLVRPHVVALTLTPGTLREGYNYHDAAKALVRLSVPVSKPLTFHITSSVADEITAPDIIFQKGEKEKSCGLVVNWKKVMQDKSVMIRVVDPERPDRVVEARLYLIKQVL